MIRIFWKISVNEEITNTEVLEKAITKLISLVKYATKTAEDIKVIDEAIENVRDGKAVLQSLKVVKELISLNEATSPEMIKYVVDRDVLHFIFENLANLKKMIREKMEKSGVDMASLTEAVINQHVSTKGFNFEQNILTRLRFIDFSRLNSLSHLRDAQRQRAHAQHHQADLGRACRELPHRD